MLQVLDFLTEKARGFILTMTGTGVGVLPEVLPEPTNNLSSGLAAMLYPYQKAAIILSIIVAAMTIISYSYKFYMWCRNRPRKKQ